MATTELTPTREEFDWLRRLEKLVQEQPPGTWVYLSAGAGGVINLLRLGPDGKRVEVPDGGVDPKMVVGWVRTENWDGGDW